MSSVWTLSSSRHCWLLFWMLTLVLNAGIASAQDTILGRAPKNWDERLLLDINHWGDPGLDGTMNAVSNTTAPVLGIVAAGMYGSGFIFKDKELSLNGALAGLSIGTASGLTFLLKAIVQRDRPFVTLADVRTPNGPEGSYSFPSGHTTGAFALATSLSLAYPRWEVIAPSMLYAALVGYSRMYVGVHYPTDVFAGAVVGVGVSYIVFLLRDEIGDLLSPILPNGLASQGALSPMTSTGLGVRYTIRF